MEDKKVYQEREINPRRNQTGEKKRQLSERRNYRSQGEGRGKEETVMRGYSFTVAKIA